MAYKRSRAAFEADLQTQQSPFVTYGTPLPPLDPEVRDDGSFVPVWQQEVRDEQGRKRLHGAFTGGFSAGYFNTVGSKEGWAPSTFVSSRSNKRKNDENKQQRPEDFMDEEDLAAMAESKQLQTDQSYAGFGSTAEDEKRQGMLMDLLRPEGETMGVKLLQKMGWRQGQGVGARIRRTAQLDISDDAPAESHMFAPENTTMISFHRKNDRKGLGYTGESKPLPSRTNTQDEEEDAEEDEESRHFSVSAKSKTKSKSKTKRTGFGTGVLNDDSDGEDPYTIGPSISYNRVVGGEKKKKKAAGAVAKTTANPLLGSRPVFRSQKISQSQATLRKCHDGRFPITGFTLSGTIDASAALSSDLLGKYPMPKIPEGWKSEKTPSTASLDPSTYQTTGEAAKLSTHDPKSRAAVLGESQLPGKSVFDFLSNSARDRLATASGRGDLPTARGESIPKSPASFSSLQQRSTTSNHLQGPLLSDDPSLPALDKSTALAALGRGINGWMPYADDAAKRARYTAFLSLRGGLAESLPPPATADKLPRDAWIQELREFAHAANVFKPMTGAMASRFTTASASGSSSAAVGPSTDSKGGEDSTKPLLQTPSSASSTKKEDPAEEAARLGMFGALTRSTAVFYPTRLVCKRFNVRPPAHVQVGGDGGEGGEGREGQGREETKARVPDLVSKEAVERMMREHAVARGGAGYAQSTSDAARDGNKDAPSSEKAQALAIEWGESKVDVEKNEALEGEKAGDAVFRAVFGDEDSSDEE